MTAAIQPSSHPSGAALLSQVLGLLREDHAEFIEHHLRRCRPCIHRATQLKQDAAQLAFALQPVEPPPLLRDTLLQAAGEIHRLYPQVRLMAQLLRLDKQKAHALLDQLDVPSFWQRCGSLWLLPVTIGAKNNGGRPAKDMAYFVRISSGSTITATDLPYRTNRRLSVVIVQGNGTDEHGALVRTGQLRRGVKDLLLTAAVGCDLILLVRPAILRSAEKKAEREPSVMQRARATATKQANSGRTQA